MAKPLSATAISTAPPQHDNAFDLIRLVLALSVIYSHSYKLLALPEPFQVWCRDQSALGTIAVLGFFGLSGFLVTASFERSANSRVFIFHRFRRILPGFWACLVVTAFVVAPLIERFVHGTLVDFPWTGPMSALSYVRDNFLLHISQWNIGHVLTGPLSRDAALNGSLWTLFPEMLCYGFVLVMGLGGAFQGSRYLLVFFFGALVTAHLGQTFAPETAVRLLPTFLGLTSLTPYVLSFASGMFLRIFRGQVHFDRRGTILTGLLLLVTLRLGGYTLIAPVLVPYFLLSLGFQFRCRLRHDLSYGMYIYGFLAQQIVLVLSGFHVSPLLLAVLAASLTFCAAALSWILIERRFLKKEIAT